MGGQRELRRHEPEWHVAPVRPVREPTHVHGRNSNTDTNRKSNPNGYRDADYDGYGNCNPHGYRDADCNGDGHSDTDCHSYTDSQRYAHTKTSPDTAASSVTGLNLQNRFQRKIRIEMIGSQPVAIEEC